MFKKILIANRGEIACRVAATASRMAIRTVAVYSDADAQAKHVSVCDQAVHLGGNSPKDSYLRWERIIEAAKATGAEAIHPGYGFLSENEEFAQACGEAGLVFIGPPSSAIQAMGLKAESKRLMDRAGVPLVPGYHGADQDSALLQREAGRIGYPVLIKASAGGGGKGMRVVERVEDFAAALASCQREAKNSFGDDAVLIEKYVQRPRHIEIQVFGDAHGNCIHLLERDCSVQRRHQKVLEESPAPGMTPAMREQMGAAAVSAARAVNYVGAGTVEFIVEQKADGSMQFFFMEMNTRLQVEHPVTEAVTGLDLVEWQLRVASGEPLPLRQDQVRLQGHAIEARICAENPDRNFLPATGALDVYALPPHAEFVRSKVRVDSGVRQGDIISPYYDSMIAKLIVHGDTREAALANLDAALAATHIVGLNTNVQFLRHVVQCRSFAEGDLDTALIPREAAALFGQIRVRLDEAVAAWVAHRLQCELGLAVAPGAWTDPWAAQDSWRAYGTADRKFELQIGDTAVVARLTCLRGGERLLSLRADGPRPWEWPAQPLVFLPKGGALEVAYAGWRQTVSVYEKQGLSLVHTAFGAIEIVVKDVFSPVVDGQAEGGRLTAPMPGKVVSIAVKAGDRVTKGQVLAVMDAMKMEHAIAAPQDGVVAEVLYAPGDQVAEGAELLKLRAAA